VSSTVEGALQFPSLGREQLPSPFGIHQSRQ
jgi:hypothetical protein